ncbi:MAG: dihydrolipoamide acetyltransferase family protein [Caulobacteraceae bacterium]|nr:dihydrolipoamide acetyltransferase family protein [Caulobacteraceae bacterium]
MGRFTFKLPDVGEGIAEAEVVAWHVAVGDQVAEDQPLADVMTDKATVELTSPVAGRVVERHGAEGDLVPVGSDLVVLETEAAASAAAPPAPKPEVVEAPEAAAPPPAPPAAPSSDKPSPGKALAAPAVRERARALGIDLASVPASGPEGRVTHADLDAVLAGGGVRAASYAPREGVQEVKVIGLRRRIAERMQESKRRIPHFTYVEEVDVTELEDLRAHLNRTHADARPKLSLLPFLMRALVQALPDWPQINATFDDEAGVVHRHRPVHIGVATQTRDGLIVPVVRHAETLDLWAAAAEVARLAGAAREGRSAREDLSGSTITITSLGPLGGVATTPVINHPEVAIIGPNRIVERPVVRAGQVAVRKMMNLSSSFDHRVVDGYDAAEFIQKIKAMLEHPATLFVA